MPIFTTPKFILPMGVYVNISPILAPAGGVPYSASFGFSMTFIRWTQVVIVNGTNNPTNYWNIILGRYIDSATITSITTLGVSVNVNTPIVTTFFNIPSVTVNDHGLFMQCTPTGSPGALYLVGPALECFGS